LFQILIVGGRQPPSAALESSKRIEERLTVGGVDQRLEGRAAPRQTRETREAREMIRGRVGITQETENEAHRPFVEGGVLEAFRMGRNSHCETPEPRNLGVGYRHPAANAGRENRLSLEEARYHLLARLDESGLLEELTESSKQLRPLPDIRGDEHH
jgi:hypothetical protein